MALFEEKLDEDRDKWIMWFDGASEVRVIPPSRVVSVAGKDVLCSGMGVPLSMTIHAKPYHLVDIQDGPS